jgi:hypothetical protein
MNFNTKVKHYLLEAGGYLPQTSKSKTPQEAINELKNNFKQIENNSKLLKVHPDRFEIDSDSYRRVLEIINTLNQWGGQIKDKMGRSISPENEVKRALDISNHPDHDYKKVTAETKITSFKPIYRKWFALYSKYFPHKALDRRTYSQDQKPEANEIFYFGDDGLPYVTRMSFDAQDNVDGSIFLRTNRFNDVQVDQISNPETGKPVRPVRFENGKRKGTIPLNSRVERAFGQPEISKAELKKILNSKEAEKAFKRRLKADPQLKAWYDKKYSRMSVAKV